MKLYTFVFRIKLIICMKHFRVIELLKMNGIRGFLFLFAIILITPRFQTSRSINNVISQNRSVARNKPKNIVKSSDIGANNSSDSNTIQGTDPDNCLSDDEQNTTISTSETETLVCNKAPCDIFSCEGRCHQFAKFPCSCDEYCGMYHTCCDDFIHQCKSVWIQSVEQHGYLMDTQVLCIDTGYLVLAGCPTYLDPVEEQKCRDNGDNTPVSVSGSGLHFRNICFLRCNMANDTVSSEWDVELSMSVSIYHKFNLEHIQKEMSLADRKFTPSVPEVYLCMPDTIEICPTGTSNELISNCQKYWLPVQGKVGDYNIFKNVFCLRCNRGGYNISKCIYLERHLSGRGTSHFSVTVNFLSSNVMQLQSPRQSSIKWKSSTCIYNAEVKAMRCTIEECHGNRQVLNNSCSRPTAICSQINIHWSKGLFREDGEMLSSEDREDLFQEIIVQTNRRIEGVLSLVSTLGSISEKLQGVFTMKVQITLKSNNIYSSLTSTVRGILDDVFGDKRYHGEIMFCVESREDEDDCFTVGFCLSNTYMNIHATSQSVHLTWGILLLVRYWVLLYTPMLLRATLEY